MSDEQSKLDLSGEVQVEGYKFQPIKGFPRLNWQGKRPFTSTQFYPAQLKESYGKEIGGWRNKIFWGDNLQVMSHMLKGYRGQIDMVYIDPPFDSKADYKKNISLKGKRASSEHTVFEEKQYGDIWANDEYLQFIYERLALLKELMSPNATIFFHCDYHQSHRIRFLMDEVFGQENFINEIIWVRSTNPKGSQHEATRFSVFTDTLFCYGKSSQSAIYPDRIRIPLSTEELKKKYHRADEKGAFYDGPIVSTAGMGERLNLVYEYGGYTPPSSGWRLKKEGLIKLDQDGNLGWTSNKKPYRKLRPKDDKGKPIGNFWNDISLVNSQASERLGYPTQKPVQLLERILKIATKPGDLVFDCFMGSGTTQEAALKMGRRYIGADINIAAIQTTTKRLINAEVKSDNRDLLDEDADPAGFEVYNVNNYDIFRNPIQAKELLIDALEIQKLEMNSIYDGEKDGRMVKIMPVNRIATKADLGSLIAGFDYKAFEKRQNDNPNQPVEKLLLVCMGHDVDLKTTLELEVKPYRIDVEVVDILRDKSKLEFKRDSEAKLAISNGHLEIERFYPMNLLQKLSLQREQVTDWREMVESIMVDWNYDGAILQPTILDVPGKKELVSGKYKIPKDASTIRVKITDLLSESWEGNIDG